LVLFLYIIIFYILESSSFAVFIARITKFEKNSSSSRSRYTNSIGLAV